MVSLYPIVEKYRQINSREVVAFLVAFKITGSQIISMKKTFEKISSFHSYFPSVNISKKVNIQALE